MVWCHVAVAFLGLLLAASSTLGAEAAAVIAFSNASTPSPWISGTYFQFSWTLFANDPTTTLDDTMQVYMSTTSSDAYLALGTSGDKMEGTAIIAFTPRAGNTSTARCELRQTLNWGLGPIVAPSTLLLASTAAGRLTVACGFSSASFGLVRNVMQRVLLASGGVNGSGFALSHGPSSRETGRVDFVGNTALIGLQTGARTVGGALLHVAFLVWVIIGGVLHYRGVLIRAAVNMALAVGFQFLAVALMGMYFGLAYKDLTDSAVSAPAARAMAHTASMAFMLMLYPVPKCFGFISIMGSSYDRAMSFHAFSALFVWLTLTAHWVSMSVQVMDQPSDALSNSDRYVFSPIVGFLSWLLITGILVIAFPLKALHFKAFRVTHYLAIPAVLLAIVHYPSVLITIAIPMINYAADLVLRAVGQCRLGAVVESVEQRCVRVHTVELRLKRGAPMPPPGAFTLCHLGLGVLTHPFTVAWFEPETEALEARVTLLVREAGDFTKQLSSSAISIAGQPAGAMGWYGSMQVPLTSREIRRVILVAGGIGISWVLRLAQCIAFDQTCAPAADLVVLLWFVSDRSFYDSLADKLASLGCLMGARLRVHVFVTQGNAPDSDFLSNPSFASQNIALSSPASNGSFARPKAAVAVHYSRPHVGSEIEAHASPDGATGVYCSGPASLMADARASVSQLPTGYYCDQRYVI